MSREPREIKATEHLIGWFEEGGVMIVETAHGCTVYDCPQYSGEPTFYVHRKTLKEALIVAESMT